METLDEKKLDYDVLKKLIYEKMPREYLEENIVEEKHYNKAPSVYVMNFNPYRNGGHILSDEFRFLDNKTEVLDKDGNSMDGLGYNMGKGMWWLPRYFLAMAKYDERHLLPCAFISLFLRHYENRLNRRGRRCGNCYIKRRSLLSGNFNIRELREHSDKELTENNYDIPDHRCKEFLCTNTKEAFASGVYDSFYDLNRDDDPTEEGLSDVIVKCIKLMTDTYRMEYWTYSGEDQKRAGEKYKQYACEAGDRIYRKAQDYSF